MAHYYRLDQIDPILRGPAEKYLSQYYKENNLNPNDYSPRITMYDDFQIAMILIPKEHKSL